MRICSRPVPQLLDARSTGYHAFSTRCCQGNGEDPGQSLRLVHRVDRKSLSARARRSGSYGKPRRARSPLFVWGSPRPPTAAAAARSRRWPASHRGGTGSMLADSSRSADSLPEPAHSANALRDVLRRCANAMSMSSKTFSRKPSSVGPRRGLVAVDADQAGVDARDRPEHRRRHHAVAAHVAVEAHLGARHAVVLAAGLGGESLGDLGLHHHHDGADGRELGEQVQQRGHRDVVRQVRDQRGRLLVAGRDGVRSRTSLVQHGQPVDLAVRVLGDGRGQLTRQHRVDLDGGHPRAAVEQRQRQRTEARVRPRGRGRDG